jgi:hypothetical protein
MRFERLFAEADFGLRWSVCEPSGAAAQPLLLLRLVFSLLSQLLLRMSSEPTFLRLLSPCSPPCPLTYDVIPVIQTANLK